MTSPRDTQRDTKNKRRSRPVKASNPLVVRLRRYLLAGVLVTAPIGITLWLIWQFISFVDDKIEPLVPARWDPQTYLVEFFNLPFDIPGFGVLFALLGLTFIGFLAANYIGRHIMRFGENLLNRVPVVRSIYGSIKQVLETLINQETSAFRRVVLVEYPREGSWAVGFVTGETEGEVQRLTDATTINVFIPATPNPTTGFLLFIPKGEVHDLDMSVEAGVKLVVSGGIVMPPASAKNSKQTDLRLSKEMLKPEVTEVRRTGLLTRLRNYFLTGILVTVPFGITAWLGWEFLGFIDSRVVPLIPANWNPEHYLPFSIPGLGVIVLLTGLILVGMTAAGFLGRVMVRTADRMLGTLPVARSIYGATKQIIETIIAQQSNAFRDTVLIEYPRRGSWAIGFITGQTEGHVQDVTQAEMANVFLPTTPNPTSGFLLFIPREETILLDMSVEEGLKMVISGGIITPADHGADDDGDDEPDVSSNAPQGTQKPSSFRKRA